MSSDEHRTEQVSRRASRGFDRKRFTELRKKRGISRSTLARLAGLSVSTINRWESGSRGPQVNTLKAVADVMGLTMSDLIDVPRDERFPGDWRVLAGLTQPQLGKIAGLETNQISAIERGEIELTEELAGKLAPALGIDAAELRACYERSRTRPEGVEP